MHSLKPISPWQFTIFRIVFGLYLAIHFAALIPYAPELFSRSGMLPDPSVNLTPRLLPNPLDAWGTPVVSVSFVSALLVLALAFAAGIFRRTAALLLWLGWACLFNRNNLISNPSLPYVGLLLLLTILVPVAEPLRLGGKPRAWFFPAAIYWTAWIALAAGYSYSGWAKLHSPSWQDGSALFHVMSNPLARSGGIGHLLLSLPAWGLQLLTWATLALELLCLPLSFHRLTRLWIWTALGLMHAGILLVIDFADLSFGMLMVHLFTFDPAWLPRRTSAESLAPEETKMPASAAGW